MKPPIPTVRIVDSHTGGEPTRVVCDGGPDLGSGTLAERLNRFRRDHDRFRAAIVNEPRGSEVLVGALLLPAEDPAATAGLVFFNNVGYLAMCGHGLIGVVATLRALNRISPGVHRFDTPAGQVRTTLHPDGTVSIANVPSYRFRADVALAIPEVGTVIGDIAWGGNWFFLSHRHGQTITRSNLPTLTAVARSIREALPAADLTGADGADIDHIELTGPPSDPQVHARNFVLCPGGAYDRSPCGTGTSAKLACLAADDQLPENDEWIQESIIGSRFIGRYQWLDRARGIILPTITGRAYVTGEATLQLDPDDPFCWGIP